MADEEEKIESMPTVPVDPNRWISVVVLPAEPLSGTYRNLTRLAALGFVIIGGVLTSAALDIWIPLGLGLGIVFSLVIWGVFRLPRAGLAKCRLSADSMEADRLLGLSPQLRVHATRRRFRHWIRKLQVALPPGSVVRVCYQKPSDLQAFSAPFEPFSVNDLPEWLHKEFEEGDLVESEEESESQAAAQAKLLAQSKVRRLLGKIGSSAVGVFAVTLLLAFFVFILGLIGYLIWLSFIAIVELVLYKKPPKFPPIVYFFSALVGISMFYSYLLSFRQIWMVPGGFVRRVSRPWRRHWDIELFRRDDCTLLLDETTEKFGSYVFFRNRILEIDFGMLGPAGSLSALLSPIAPPDLSELSDLR